MEKFVPYDKLSKKEKRRLDTAKRGTWGRINPVTRKPQNSKAYNRKRTQDWKKELPDPVSFIFGACQTDRNFNKTQTFPNHFLNKLQLSYTCKKKKQTKSI